jgi:hypothetical protein
MLVGAGWHLNFAELIDFIKTGYALFREWTSCFSSSFEGEF